MDTKKIADGLIQDFIITDTLKELNYSYLSAPLESMLVKSGDQLKRGDVVLNRLVNGNHMVVITVVEQANLQLVNCKFISPTGHLGQAEFLPHELLLVNI